ncbi:MAG TPA: glycosyltransferase [Gemmatimonadales bacterium]|nr:glycosyltransferase [Gemmatimonadales bacterium]
MTDPTRIGFLSTVHPHPWAPTKGVFNQGLLTSLSGAGARVAAVVPVPWTERRGPAARLEPGYEAYYPLWLYLPRIAPLRLADQMQLCTRVTRKRLWRPDVVLSYWTDPDGTVASRWAATIGVPFVQMVGGSDALVLGTHPARRERMIRTLRVADRILTIGPGLRDTLEDWGLDTGKISVFQRGVDRTIFFPAPQAEARERLGLPSDRPILAWAGRLVDVKGIDVLLSALQDPALLRLRPLVVLLGEGPRRSSLEATAQTSLPSDTVRFVGRVPHGALPDWYRAADLMVLPSHSEGVPNVLLEAMACGTGFVASAVGGIPELAGESTSELVPPGDSIALAETLVRRLTAGTIAVRPVPDRRETASGLLEVLKDVIAERACPPSTTNRLLD